LGAVGGYDLGGGPGVAVGEQDAFAEQAGFQRFAGCGVGGEAQPQVGGFVAGEGGGEDVADPAGFADGGDFGLDRGAGAAGLAAGQLVGQGGQPLLRLGEGLVEAAGLGGVQGLGVGQHRAAGHPQRGHRSIDVGQAGEAVRVHGAVAGTGNGQQAGVIAGRQRPDEPDPGGFHLFVVGGRILPCVVDQGQIGHVGGRLPKPGGQLVDQLGELGDVGPVTRVGVRQQGDAAVAGDHQRQPDQPQVHPLLFGLAALRDRGPDRSSPYSATIRAPSSVSIVSSGSSQYGGSR
jgi:hypothetical protein